MRHLLTRTATVTRRAQTGTADVYGDPTWSTSTATLPCWLHQTYRDDDTALTQQQTQTWTAYFPADADLEGVDAVTVDGEAFELVGPPWLARNPRTGVSSHVEATLKRVV